MKIVVAGGSGFLGSTLVDDWRAAGHQVLVLTRRPRREDDVRWSTEPGDTTWTPAIDGADAIVNLAGEGIADKRWSSQRKAAIIDSRIRATRAIVAAIKQANRPPTTLISSSAIGIYGADREDELLTEDSAIGSDFLARTCADWEREANAAADLTRVVLLRTGVVLSNRGGALPRIALPFRFLAGGPLGSGGQYMSWIHLADWTRLARWALDNSSVAGALNLTAPSPVTNADFSHALGRALRRPSVVRTPAFALRLALGEMADALLLGGQRVLPAKAQRNGFAFTFAALEAALQEIYQSREARA